MPSAEGCSTMVTATAFASAALCGIERGFLLYKKKKVLLGGFLLTYQDREKKVCTNFGAEEVETLFKDRNQRFLLRCNKAMFFYKKTAGNERLKTTSGTVMILACAPLDLFHVLFQSDRDFLMTSANDIS